jgi:hypothetical protein
MRELRHCPYCGKNHFQGSRMHLSHRTKPFTEQLAIARCKEIWQRIKKSGTGKTLYFNEHPELQDIYAGNCPLCTYASQINAYGCAACPLKEQYGENCWHLGFESESLPAPSRWYKAIEGLH